MCWCIVCDAYDLIRTKFNLIPVVGGNFVTWCGDVGMSRINIRNDGNELIFVFGAFFV